MSHEDKSRENIPSVKCYYMYTISQYIKSRNDLELQYSPISIHSFTCPQLPIIGCDCLQKNQNAEFGIRNYEFIWKYKNEPFD